jgi:hypothetical protein
VIRRFPQKADEMMVVNGRATKLGGRGILPGRIQTSTEGKWLLCAANASLIVLFLTYLSLKPGEPHQSALLQKAREAGGSAGEALVASASHLKKMHVSSAAILAQVKSSSSSKDDATIKKEKMEAKAEHARELKNEKLNKDARRAGKPAKASLSEIEAAGVKAGAALWQEVQRASKEMKQVKQESLAAKKQTHVQLAACGECVYKDNPLSEIDEPNVFPGPSEYGPDSPTALGPLGNAVNSACCNGNGENAFGAPVLSVKDMRKVFEIGEPNFREWKEFEKENNIFPGIVDWDPDSPKGYNPPEGVGFGPELFDGHGGIIGLEPGLPGSPEAWKTTPESAAYRDYSKYADEGNEGMDRNVYANGYVFPDY